MAISSWDQLEKFMKTNCFFFSCFYKAKCLVETKDPE